MPIRRGDGAVERVHEVAGAPHRVAASASCCGQRLDLGAELSRLGHRAWVSATSPLPARPAARSARSTAARPGRRRGRRRRPVGCCASRVAAEIRSKSALTCVAADDEVADAARRPGWRCRSTSGCSLAARAGRRVRRRRSCHAAAARSRAGHVVAHRAGRAAPVRRRPAGACHRGLLPWRPRRSPGRRSGTPCWPVELQGWTRRRPGRSRGRCRRSSAVARRSLRPSAVRPAGRRRRGVDASPVAGAVRRPHRPAVRPRSYRRCRRLLRHRRRRYRPLGPPELGAAVGTGTGGTGTLGGGRGRRDARGRHRHGSGERNGDVGQRAPCTVPRRPLSATATADGRRGTARSRGRRMVLSFAAGTP